MLESGNLEAVRNLLPGTVTQATKEPPICEVIKITGQNSVVRFIEFELVRMSSLVSVGNNLSNAQVQFIATKMVEMFPNESLADFKLCFERGCIGQYGEIFRMDGIVLRKWMEKYLDEKYQVIETELMNGRDTPYATPDEADGPGYREFKAWAKTLQEQTKVPGMTDADHRKYGQEKPVKKTATAGYAWFEVRGIKLMATSQEHAEELVDLMIKRGDLQE